VRKTGKTRYLNRAVARYEVARMVRIGIDDERRTYFFGDARYVSVCERVSSARRNFETDAFFCGAFGVLAVDESGMSENIDACFYRCAVRSFDDGFDRRLAVRDDDVGTRVACHADDTFDFLGRNMRNLDSRKETYRCIFLRAFDAFDAFLHVARVCVIRDTERLDTLYLRTTRVLSGHEFAVAEEGVRMQVYHAGCVVGHYSSSLRTST
jgi:hypothetical protein